MYKVNYVCSVRWKKKNGFCHSQNWNFKTAWLTFLKTDIKSNSSFTLYITILFNILSCILYHVLLLHHYFEVLTLLIRLYLNIVSKNIRIDSSRKLIFRLLLYIYKIYFIFYRSTIRQFKRLSSFILKFSTVSYPRVTKSEEPPLLWRIKILVSCLRTILKNEIHTIQAKH